jgi:hypothetical protein
MRLASGILLGVVLWRRRPARRHRTIRAGDIDKFCG